MCIAIFQPVGETVSKDILQECFNRNSDGCGFAYANSGEIKVFHSMVFDSFYDKYVTDCLEFGSVSSFLIHFRIQTHGSKDIGNCHPFLTADKKIAVVHNGVLFNMKAKSGVGPSDTSLFCSEILSTMGKCNIVENKAAISLIEKFVGTSRLVLMNSDGKHIIINENDGLWKDGVWYSNKSIMYRSGLSNSQQSWNSSQGTIFSFPTKTLESNKPKLLHICSGCGRVLHSDSRMLASVEFWNKDKMHVCMFCLKKAGMLNFESVSTILKDGDKLSESFNRGS